MDAITYTAARQNMAKIMDEVTRNNEVKIITRTNNPSVVMMSLEDYNAWMETCYLLGNPANAKHLQKSLEQADKEEFVNVSLEEL